VRSRHGDPQLLKRIASAIAFEWNCAYQPPFHANGDPALSTIGITVNFFWIGAFHFFGQNPARARQWMRENLFDIVFFAESTCDTLATSIQGRFGEDKQPKEQRAYEMASIVYGWLLRQQRPWWRHPRWHVHHWRISCRPFWRNWFTAPAKSAVEEGKR